MCPAVVVDDMTSTTVRTRSATRARRLGLSAALLLALVGAACGSDGEETVAAAGDPTPTTETPIPVEPDGGIGDEADDPIPVEPDGGIGDSPFASVPFFGGNDDQCASVTLANEPGDDALRQEALDCFFAEYDAGNPVVVDLAIPTVEGDLVYHRYAFDGSATTIVVDYRLDAFSGGGGVDARTCAAVEPGDFLPTGIDCTPIADHPGFPEADVG